MRYPTATLRQRLLRSGLARNEGNVAILFALVLPLVVGSAGLGVETSYWYYKRLQLQGAADSAAHAGALERRSGSNAATVASIATQTAEDNGFAPASGTIVVNAPPLSGPSAGGNAVEVLLTLNGERFFTNLFADGPVLITARAVASYNTASNACVLALHNTASAAARFQGSATVTLNGCSVMSNSIAADSVLVQGATVVSTDCLVAVGGVVAGGTVTMTECEAPVTNAPPVADPYANVPPPPVPAGPCRPHNFGPQPGVNYCNGLTLSGNVTLAPGVYYVSGGNFSIAPNSNITGDGVTFYFGPNVNNISFNNNSTYNLTAPGPDSGSPYAGMLFYGDRSGGASDVTLNGTANSLMTGAIYFPTRTIRYNGNFSGQNGCTQVVGSIVWWTGNTSVSADCSDYGIRDIPVLSLVKLTE